MCYLSSIQDGVLNVFIDLIWMGIFRNRIFKGYSQIIKKSQRKNWEVLHLVSNNIHLSKLSYCSMVLGEAKKTPLKDGGLFTCIYICENLTALLTVDQIPPENCLALLTWRELGIECSFLKGAHELLCFSSSVKIY